MNHDELAARRRLILETFHRDLDDDIIIALGSRLDAAVTNVKILVEWEASIEDCAPAAVHSTPARQSDVEGDQ